jgi:hypothetical protein
MGQCHCKVGFAPPYCDYPGPGGSLDGGPASDPNGIKLPCRFNVINTVLIFVHHWLCSEKPLCVGNVCNFFGHCSNIGSDILLLVLLPRSPPKTATLGKNSKSAQTLAAVRISIHHFC